jgi:hypothetical protein
MQHVTRVYKVGGSAARPVLGALYSYCVSWSEVPRIACYVVFGSCSCCRACAVPACCTLLVSVLMFTLAVLSVPV